MNLKGDLLPKTVTFKNGCAVFQASFAAPGQDTVTVTDQQTSTLSGQATVNVTAAAMASQYAISLLPPSPGGQFGTPTVTTGTAVTVQVQALDAQHQPVTDYSGTEAVSCSDSTASCPTSVTFVNGVGTFPVTFTSTGTPTITVSDTTNDITGTLKLNVVAPAVATQYANSILPPVSTVQTPGGPGGPIPQPPPPGSQTGTPTVATGTAVTVQVVALDAQNRPVTNYSGTETVSCSDSTATCPTTITFVKGIGTFQATFTSTGTPTITISDTVNKITGTLKLNVVAPAVATQYAISILPPAGSPAQPPAGQLGTPTVATGTPVTVQVVALDAQNHPVTTYSGTETVTCTDTATGEAGRRPLPLPTGWALSR